MGRRSSKVVVAAGAVVWRPRKRSVEVLLIHRPRYDDWSWPKGKLDPGESLPACAVREVAEETGVQVVLGRPLPAVSYRLTSGATKVSHYWAATVAPEGAAAVRARTRVKPAKNEVDEVRWVSAEKAMRMLSRRSDRAPLSALLDYLDEGRLDTWAVQLARHGRARSRSAWAKGEDTRPLTSAGRRQALGLVPLLSAFGAEEVVTSPWARCRDTVAPYAEAAGLDLVLAPQLTEDGAEADPRSARALVLETLRTRSPGAALCLHRPTLPLVLDAVSARSVHRVRDLLPETDPWLAKGELLVLHLATPGKRKARVVAAELHRT